jgi:phosphonate ABC transporter permease subunit PhnE
MKTNEQPKASIWRSIGIGVAIVVAVVIYAYGFQVTKVNLEETKSARRQEQLIRIIRALAKPDILEYTQEELKVSVPIQVPCATTDWKAPEPDRTKPYVVVTPACAEPGSEVVIEGFNMPLKTEGPLNFIPPSKVNLDLGDIQTDANGYFKISVNIPNRPDTTEQKIEAVVRRPVGAPHLTQTAYDTWDKIIETIFLALLATTIGTLLSIPLSFFAARNLMKEMVGNLIGLSTQAIAIPIGFFAGGFAAIWMSSLGDQIAQNIPVSFALLVIVPFLLIRIVRWALPQEETNISRTSIKLLRFIAVVICLLVLLISVSVLAGLMDTSGRYLEIVFGSLGFLGSFLKNVGQILRLLIAVVAALVAAGTLSSFAGRMGIKFQKRFSPVQTKSVGILLAMLAGAIIFVLIGAGVNWIYQIENPVYWAFWPGVGGAAIGLLLGIRSWKSDLLPVGMVVYYITRTILNALRSIESLIMVIVFVVWVGIGPFAGVLALSLHTVAALAKLYSEQVESILAGPVEAIKATGANRLQTIIYAVVPQIIPPYISFTMYRWDINVRMSTIIGFAGGGGIGFLLIQNINLLNYRAASTQMIAIALVVASMDYLSSRMREKVV